jgi:hypothetical protein
MTTDLKLEVLDRWNPFKNAVWRGMDSPVTKEEVKACLETCPPKGSDMELVPMDPFKVCTRQEHAMRIATFVRDFDPTPIDIDVGVPQLGCRVDWIIMDGNHRLAAAFYLNMPTIKASISGSTSYATELLELE